MTIARKGNIRIYTEGLGKVIGNVTIKEIRPQHVDLLVENRGDDLLVRINSIDSQKLVLHLRGALGSMQLGALEIQIAEKENKGQFIWVRMTKPAIEDSFYDVLNGHHWRDGKPHSRWNITVN